MAIGQANRICKSVYSNAPQIAHDIEKFGTLLAMFVLVGRACTAICHKKSLILGGTFSFKIFFQISLPQLVLPEGESIPFNEWAR